MGRIIFFILLLCPILLGFYTVNERNYEKHRYIELHVVQHPETLPNAHTAKISSFGFQNLVADLYWLKTIQYIGGNAISAEYKKYLYVMIDLITDLNPYFESPYVIGQLLLPSSNAEYEDFSQEDILENIRQGESLGKKGLKNFCESEKLELIFQENDMQKIMSDPLIQNPCESYKIPYYLAYIYFFYLHDGLSAAKYYKVVAAQEDAPTGARVLAAIMQGKGGEREKSLYMFLSLARSLGSPDEACSFMSQKVEEAYTYISKNKIPLSSEMLAAILSDRDQILPKLTEENEKDVLSDTQCTNYLAKATRELTLMYIEAADARYVADHPEEVSAKTPETLFEKGYISFIPRDYQQYSDYGIVYRYNSEIGRFDYEMGY